MSLSQDEIDALLASDPGSSDGAAETLSLSEEDKEFVLSFEKTLLEALCRVWGMLAGGEISAGTPELSETSAGALKFSKEWSGTGFVSTWTGDVEGKNLFVIDPKSSLMVADKMMGKETEEGEEPGEMHISALGEAVNQFIGALMTQVSQEDDFKGTFEAQPPEGQLGSAAEISETVFEGIETLLMLSTSLTFEGGQEGELLHLMTMETAKSICSLNPKTEATEDPAAILQEETAAAAAPAAAPHASPVSFAEFGPGTATKDTPEGLSRLMKVPLVISTELGRTEMKIADILSLSPGSLIELDRLAGEQVDLLVNGILFAKGEVVVIDENFGVRITSILSPKERLEEL
jgi:flagellar motor switch protein FliN/FliY